MEGDGRKKDHHLKMKDGAVWPQRRGGVKSSQRPVKCRIGATLALERGDHIVKTRGCGRALDVSQGRTGTGLQPVLCTANIVAAN